MKISLTEFEMAMAASAGTAQHYSAMANSRGGNNGQNAGDSLSNNINGFCAEIAFGKAFNLYWTFRSGEGFKNPDFITKKGRVDVKFSNPRNPSLKAYKGQIHDDWTYVLVTGVAPHMEILGWIMGKDIARDDRWKEPAKGRWCWCVPPAELTPFKS